MSTFEIARGYYPGAIGRITELHGAYYHEHWGFGAFFETMVARGVATFVDSYDSDRDGLWLACIEGEIEGAIAVDGTRADTEGAFLRWFIVSDALRGKGAGSQLVRRAMDFCDEHRYDPVVLNTFAGLDAARHLYEREGFVVVSEEPGSHYGAEVIEQRFERRRD